MDTLEYSEFYIYADASRSTKSSFWISTNTTMETKTSFYSSSSMILLIYITYLWNTIDSSPVQTVASGLNIGNSGPSSKLVRHLIRPRICYHLCRRLSPQVNC